MSPYVIYARKSTESEDRQVVSIESQVNELRLLAARQGIHVADVLTESRSAKRPGRPVFGELLRRIYPRPDPRVLEDGPPRPQPQRPRRDPPGPR